jgi:hypothetical protein
LGASPSRPLSRLLVSRLLGGSRLRSASVERRRDPPSGAARRFPAGGDDGLQRSRPGGSIRRVSRSFAHFSTGVLFSIGGSRHGAWRLGGHVFDLSSACVALGVTSSIGGSASVERRRDPFRGAPSAAIDLLARRVRQHPETAEAGFGRRTRLALWISPENLRRTRQRDAAPPGGASGRVVRRASIVGRFRRPVQIGTRER